jgi:hypothetical protein
MVNLEKINRMGKKPSGFLNLSGIEYFKFEEDFIEENVRCIPMIVRFKMDAVGIKLKLAEWSKFNVEERRELAVRPYSSIVEVKSYHDYLVGLVRKYTGAGVTEMIIEKNPLWSDLAVIPLPLMERAKEVGREISIAQWQGLTNLQRFALLKLCRPGHESRNFIKALEEFKIA